MNPTLEYYRKRKTSLDFMLKYSRRKFSKKGFHQFRVEVKKLKAILLRMEFLLSDFNGKKFYKPFRKLFAKAGRVREIQIEKDLLKTFGQSEEIPDYLNYLDKKIRKERARFFRSRNLKLNSKIEKRLKVFGRKCREITQLDSGPFMASLITEIKTLLASGTLAEQSAHLLRKKLKNLKYNLESIRGEKFVNRHPEQEELVNLLGTWHDLVTVDRTLKSVIPNLPLREEEKESLQKINQKIHSESEMIFNEINQKIPLFDDFILPPKLKSSFD